MKKPLHVPDPLVIGAFFYVLYTHACQYICIRGVEVL